MLGCWSRSSTEGRETSGKRKAEEAAGRGGLFLTPSENSLQHFHSDLHVKRLASHPQSSQQPHQCGRSGEEAKIKTYFLKLRRMKHFTQRS